MKKSLKNLALKKEVITNFDLKKVMKLVDKEKPEFFAGVPAIYNAIAKSPDIDSYDFNVLLLILTF